MGGRVVKPFSEACEQNKRPILEILRQELDRPGRVLEVGSGSGQHAVFFSRELPHLEWIASDLGEALPGIALWLEEAELPNLKGPYLLDVLQGAWPVTSVSAVFSANPAHIMNWAGVVALFAGVGRILEPGGRFLLYGPFNYDGAYTSESNARFDQWLRERDPQSGVRDFADLDALALDNGLALRRDYAMPVNNRTLVWERAA